MSHEISILPFDFKLDIKKNKLDIFTLIKLSLYELIIYISNFYQ